MLGLYHESKKVGYTAGSFLRMLSELGPIETARRLIEADTPSTASHDSTSSTAST